MCHAGHDRGGGVGAALTFRLVARVGDRAERDTDTVAVEAASRTVEYARAQPVLRAFGQAGGPSPYRQLDDAVARHHRVGRRSVTTVVPALGANAAIVQAGYTALLALGAYLAVGGAARPAELIALLALATRCAEPLALAAELAAALRAGHNSLARFADPPAR